LRERRSCLNAVLTVRAVKLGAGEVDQAHVRLTFRLVVLMLGAVAGMCAGAYFFGRWR